MAFSVGGDGMECVKCKKSIQEDALYCQYCGKKQTVTQRKTRKRANGMGSVYKLPGRRSKPWTAVRSGVYLGYYETKTAALQELERTARKNITERYNMTFAEVYEEWKAEHFREVGVSGQTSYMSAFNIFAELHDRKFRDLKTADFQAVIDQHMSKSHSTVAKYKQLVTQMSQWAIREELITVNLASFAKLPENIKKEKEIFTDGEIALLEKDGSETARIILMMIYTGMRIGELFSLPLDAYHGNYVIGGEKTEAGRNRIIPIRPEGQKHFQYFADKVTDQAQLISGYSGAKDISNFRKRNYYPLLEKLGIPQKTPHACRHTFASWAVKSGVSPEILQKVLGHAKYTTTAEIYVHADADQLINAIAK